MKSAAVIAIARMLEQEWGEHGYWIQSMQRHGWHGDAIAVCAHSDGSRFVIRADRHGQAELVAEGSELEAAVLEAVA